MNKQEFKEVTKVFLKRLEDQIETAGCNDLYEDEFPKSICEKFGNDSSLFDDWKKILDDRLNKKQ